MLMSLRLFSRAPCTRMTSWLSASCRPFDCVSGPVVLLIVCSSFSLAVAAGSGLSAPPSTLGQRDVAVAVAAHLGGPQLEQHVAVGGSVTGGGDDRRPYAGVVDGMPGAAHGRLAAGAGVVRHAVVQCEPPALAKICALW